MKKLIGQLHLWLGLASGLVVFIIAVTGCIYVFEEELKAWLYTDRTTITVPEKSNPKPLSELLTHAQQLAGEQHPIQNIEIETEASSTYSFRPAQIRDKHAYTHFGEIVYQHRFYINPYTSELVKDENTKLEFFTVVLRLHRNLLLNRDIGKLIIGSSVLVFVVMLITGIVLWWPKNKFSFKKAISFQWKNSTGWKRKNYDLHNVPGFYSLFILLAIALTGLTWSFDWFENGTQWIANGGAKQKKIKPLYSDTTRLGATMPVDKILYQLTSMNPDANSLQISLPNDNKGVITASARSGKHVRYTQKRYQFDQYTGTLLTTTAFDDKNAGEKLKAMTYDIHVGAILGLPGKVLAFFASLIAASLPITGVIIWWGRKFKKEKKKNKVPVHRSAARPLKARQPVIKTPTAKVS